ncbi:MAG: hypothetical protein JRI55_35745 [Deltaproteobacteria bacterium]|nr:hypothetical protein [Deltaproteobacteria bacterium]
MQKLRETIATAVGNGMRATLNTGNLLTGSRYVYIDMFPDAPPDEVGEYAGFPTIPTVAGGLEGIQVRIATLLDKLNALPLEDLLGGVDRLIADIDRVVASEGVQALPASLDETLGELRDVLDSVSTDSAMQTQLLRTLAGLDRTLLSLRNLLETLDEQPNAIIFNRELGEDPEPPAGSP